MASSVPNCYGDPVHHFAEGVLRPPVPGEENVKRDAVRPESYEPEGRDSPDHADPSWAKSLSALLDDQDGVTLFRDFLKRQGCTDAIDFWLACSGFGLAYCSPASYSSPSAEMFDKRRLKLAKAIYRKYILSSGIVAKKIKQATKSLICERVRRAQLDSTLFEQAKQEVQEAMEVEVFPVFCKSEIFLAYTQGICTEPENHQQELNKQEENEKKEPITSEQDPNSTQEGNRHTPKAENYTQEIKCPVQLPGSEKKDRNQKAEVPRFLAELTEKKEWVGPDAVSANHERPEHWEAGYKLKRRIIQSCVRADTHTTYLRRMHIIHHMPKDIHTEQNKFAADLISRLKLVQKERENWRQVKEHLNPFCKEDDVAESTLCPAHLISAHFGSFPSAVQWGDICFGNPEIFPDEQCQCVLRTTSWSSPTDHSHSHVCTKKTDACHCEDVAGANQSEAPGYRKGVSEHMTVAYYFCGEPIPYRTTVKGGVITLAHFRELLTKKGAYRFFFKKASDDFDCGVVYEEVRENDSVLPVFEGRIICKVEKIN